MDRADTAMAERVFSDAPEVSFINPRGEDRGRQQIVTNFYYESDGRVLLSSKAHAKDVSIHLYRDTAWSEVT